MSNGAHRRGTNITARVSKVNIAIQHTGQRNYSVIKDKSKFTAFIVLYLTDMKYPPVTLPFPHATYVT